jgi:uncharacterized protein with GYD domain
MATFILFGKYSADALKGVSGARTKKAAALVKKLKGKVIGMYAMLGEKDWYSSWICPAWKRP